MLIHVQRSSFLPGSFRCAWMKAKIRLGGAERFLGLTSKSRRGHDTLIRLRRHVTRRQPGRDQRNRHALDFVVGVAMGRLHEQSATECSAGKRHEIIGDAVLMTITAKVSWSKRVDRTTATRQNSEAGDYPIPPVESPTNAATGAPYATFTRGNSLRAMKTGDRCALLAEIRRRPKGGKSTSPGSRARRFPIRRLARR